MKILLKLNFIALGIPVVLGIVGFISADFFMLALLSTMITGSIQIVLALAMFIINYRNLDLYIYATITLMFFTLWLGFKIHNGLIWALPPGLAIYLTYIIITTYKKSLL